MILYIKTMMPPIIESLINDDNDNRFGWLIVIIMIMLIIIVMIIMTIITMATCNGRTCVIIDVNPYWQKYTKRYQKWFTHLLRIRFSGLTVSWTFKYYVISKYSFWFAFVCVSLCWRPAHPSGPWRRRDKWSFCCL